MISIEEEKKAAPIVVIKMGLVVIRRKIKRLQHDPNREVRFDFEIHKLALQALLAESELGRLLEECRKPAEDLFEIASYPRGVSEDRGAMLLHQHEDIIFETFEEAVKNKVFVTRQLVFNKVISNRCKEHRVTEVANKIEGNPQEIHR